MARHSVLRAIRLAVLLATVAIASGMQVASSTQVAAGQGEIVITCQECESSPTDVFSQSWYNVVQAFNRTYKGKYRVEVQHYGGTANDLQYWERLALANALPDIFIAQSTQLQALSKAGKLLDLAPYLAKDKAWKNSFYPDSFESLTGPAGQILGIAEERDVIGIFYNKALFARAGVTSFPTTWSAFLDACKKLKAAHVIPFAMDGDWVTQLMWANLIGTQPGGAQFLLSGIRKGNYASNSLVVKATEFLKGLHTGGYVNKDAFTGDYPNASNPFLQEQAAMIANGPWMVQADIEGKSALPGLYKQIGYVPSPGWTSGGQGVIVLAGNAGVASGTTDPAKRAAVVAFMKFATSPAIQLQRTIKTGAYWAVKLTLSPQQIKQLDPLTYHLITTADTVKYHYPHAKFATLQPFSDAWKNYWPGYVQGALTTKDFLDKLAQAELTAQSAG
jgi:ABC-type glycerol-3-phosphate transport system substrate-binding protein